MANEGLSAQSGASPVGGWTADGEATIQSVFEDASCPALSRDALRRRFSWQVRVETTVRRALASPRLAASFVAALLALGAEVTVERADRRETAPLRSLIDGEVTGRVAAVHVPTCGGARRCGQAMVARTPGDEPIVAAYGVLEVEDGVVAAARLALTGVWSEPARLAQACDALNGRTVDEVRAGEVARELAHEVADEVDPPDDFLGSAAYRRAMAEVLARRALEACLLEQGASAPAEREAGQ